MAITRSLGSVFVPTVFVLQAPIVAEGDFNMEKFKIKTNVILGNIYARNQHLLDLRAKDKKVRAKEGKVYYELLEKTTVNGIKQELTAVPYPITADFVKSHASATDYRNNIVESWNAPARGVNIGDAVSVQELLARDTSQARALIQHLQEEVAKAEKVKQANAPVQEKVNEGVENNG